MTGHDPKAQNLFAELPRRHRFGAAVVVGTWLTIAIAFIADTTATRSSTEWLYRLEARRADFSRAFAAEQQIRAAEEQQIARAATPPAAQDRLAQRQAGDAASERERASIRHVTPAVAYGNAGD